MDQSSANQHLTLAKYQHQEGADSGYGDSGFGGSFCSTSSDVTEIKTGPTEETIPEHVQDTGVLLEQLSIQENLTDIQQQQERENQIISYIRKAFTPDSDCDTYLTILLAKNEVLQATQLIEICPRPEYLDIQNNLGQAAIHVAAYLNLAGILHNLILRGAKLDLVDAGGKNVFHICSDRGHLETLNAIVDAGNKTNQVNIMRALLNERDYCGYTPFFQAVSQKHQHICQALVRLGADVNATDIKNGNSPLHESVMPEEADQVFVGFLLKECKLNVNHQNMAGITPLHIAASKNDKAICSVLLLYRADVNLQDINNNIPADYATNSDIINHLQIPH